VRPIVLLQQFLSANMLQRSQRKRRTPTSHIDNTPSAQKTQKHRRVADATSKRAPAKPPRLIMDQPMAYSASPITTGSTISSMIINTTAAATPGIAILPSLSQGNITQPSTSTMVFQSNLNLPNTNIDICSKAEDELGSHVAPKIKEKITSGVYVDLASLLQNSVVVDSEKHQKLAIVKGELVLQDKHTKKINSIVMWTNALIVYLSIYCSVHCEFS
jgi:hypothetical protein